MHNFILNTLGFNNRARIVFAEATELVSELQASISLQWEIEHIFLEFISTMCLLAGPIDEKQRVYVKLKGDTAKKSMVASVEANGNVRGYVNNDFVSDLKIDNATKHVFGRNGIVSVQRDSGMFDTYTGITQMKYESVAKNIEHYYRQSEQLPTSIQIFTSYRDDGEIYVARGIMLQLLPSESKSILTDFVDIVELKQELFSDPKVCFDFNALNNIFSGELKYMVKKPLNYHCGCTKEAYYGLIFALSPAEIDEILSHKQTLHATCDMCGKEYPFSYEEIARLFGLPLQIKHTSEMI